MFAMTTSLLPSGLVSRPSDVHPRPLQPGSTNVSMLFLAMSNKALRLFPLMLPSSGLPAPCHAAMRAWPPHSEALIRNFSKS